MISFTVYGTPVPQGSMRAFVPKGWTRAVVTGDNAKTKPWRQEVALMARDAMNLACKSPALRPLGVSVACDFYFSRPKSTPRRVVWKTTKPDIDKLLRSVLDALKGVCYEDDGQVIWACPAKYFDAQPRAEIRVTVIEQGAR